jgi:mannose-6-phosphate isomerase-like protein (cupin superfamily)
MSEPTVVPPGGGEVIGDSPDRRVEILCDDDAVHATWSRFAAGREGADLHIHRHHTDLFYVLDGELTLRLGLEDEPVTVTAGQLATVPPYVVHGFRNGSDADVRYLNFHVPGMRFADYMRAMRDGREFSYDQEPPPEEGLRPTSGVTIGAAGGDIVTELTLEAGERVEGDSLRFLYVLDGMLDTAGPGAWVELPAGASGAAASDARVLSVGD